MILNYPYYRNTNQYYGALYFPSCELVGSPSCTEYVSGDPTEFLAEQHKTADPAEKNAGS